MFQWFEDLLDPLAPAPVRQPPQDVGAFFRHYLTPFRGLLAVTLVVTLITAISELVLYVFVGSLVDRMTTTGPEAFTATHGVLLAVMAAVVLFLRPAAMLVSRSFVNISLVPGLSNLVRWRAHRYVSRQSLAFFQNDFAGRIAQKVLQTGPALRESVINVVDGVWFLLIYLVGAVILFGQIDFALLLPILIWVGGYVATIIFLVPKVRDRSADLAESTSMLTGRVVDSYTNILTVKLFSDPDREDAFVRAGFDDQIDKVRQLMRSIVVLTVTLTVLNGLLLFAVGALSIWLWMAGALTVGSIAVAIGLIIRITQMSGWILRTITALFENIGTVQNGMETIALPTSVVDRPQAETLAVTKGRIGFDGIRFHYGKDGGVIENLTLEIAPGEKVGLVGRSGAGKSTLVNLLLRFYDLEGGRITIDGQDIADVSQNSLRAAIGMVTQDTSLLHRSIRDNIIYGRPDTSDEEMLAAARKAAAHDFILDLSDRKGRTGYDAHVGERGVKLSGGQRQRIAIARVLLKNAPILVLDEATSALDSDVEAAIQEQLYNLMEGKTVIAIAHRLSTIAAMDRLVVMDEGHIVEEGTHDALIAKGGLYAGLWARQSGGFLARESAA